MNRVIDGVDVIEAALLLGPPAAVALYFTIRILARRLLPWMCTFTVAYITSILLATAIGLQFATPMANITSGALAWPAWCFCCACGCWAKAPSVRAMFWVVALPSVGLSYLFGWVGFLVVGDMAQTPVRAFETPELACEFTMWDSGYSVVLYRKLTAVPGLRLRLTEARVDERTVEPRLSCGDLDDRFSRADTQFYPSSLLPSYGPLTAPANGRR